MCLRDLGFVDIGWKCVARRNLLCQPVGIPDDPDGDLLGFSLSIPYKKKDTKYRLLGTAKKALDIGSGN